jgi:PAS domain S-box-containing protein
MKRDSVKSWPFQHQLTLLFGVAVFCSALVGGIVNSWLVNERLLRQVFDNGNQVASGFARQSTLALLYGLGENAREAARVTLGFPGVAYVAIYDTLGDRLLAEGSPPDWQPPKDFVPHDVSMVTESSRAWHFVAPVYERRKTDDNDSPFEVAVSTTKLLGYVQVVFDKEGLSRTRRAIFFDNFVNTFVGAAIVLVLLQWLTQRLTRPLDKLSDLMRRAERGETGVRATPLGPREVLAMSQAFNTMLAVLEERARTLDTKNQQLVRAVAEREKAEVTARESEARLSAVIANAVDGIITMDERGRIESVNPAVQTIFGFAPEELLGGNVEQLMDEPQRSNHASYLHAYLEGGRGRIVGVGPREVQGRRKDGTLFPVELAVGEMQLQGRRLFVGMVRDISARKEAERQLIAYRDHLQDMVNEQTRDLIVARDAALVAERAMSSFIANMSHELRTPLHGILSYARFGMRKWSEVSPDKLNSYFVEIHDSGTRLMTLLNNLLDLSKLRAGKMNYRYRLNTIDGLVRSVCGELSAWAEEKGVKLDNKGAVCDCAVEMDHDKITQVLRNLISNAVKFSAPESVVEVAACVTAAGDVEVSVSDSGVGVPEQELRDIFDPFVQSSKTDTHAGGTGLGLAICREIIEVGHNGWIRAENRPEGGAKFTFSVPQRRARRDGQ